MRCTAKLDHLKVFRHFTLNFLEYELLQVLPHIVDNCCEILTVLVHVLWA